MEKSPTPQTQVQESESEAMGHILPPQYAGMTAEAVDIAWSIPQYLDTEKTAAELTRKEAALEYLRNLKNEPDAEPTVEYLSAENNEIAAENADASIEQFLAQPNVIAAQKELEKILQSTTSTDSERVKKCLYALLTKRSWLYEEQQRRGSTDLTWMVVEYQPQQEWYRNTLEALEAHFTNHNIETNSNPGWFSVTASKREAGNAEGAHHKVYDTLAIADYGKITELPKLVDTLSALGTLNGESIKIKIPNGFLGFATHNDSLVIHCDTAETSAKIEKIITAWKHDNKLQPTVRELNRATTAIDGKSEVSDEVESFSQLVASQIAAWVEEHKENYPPEVIASEAIKHTISLAQKTPTATRA